MSHSYAIHTMGCKLNVYDSEVIAQGLEAAGFQRIADIYRASLVVINTCTVTGKSDAEARTLMRRVKRRNPDCFLVATGCYVQSQVDLIRHMDEVDFASTNVGKYRVGPMVDAFHQGMRGQMPKPGIDREDRADFRLLRRYRAKTRAFVKIQDGCHFRCAFCIVPSVRGPSRSVPAEAIVAQLRLLVEGGVAEAVLTGIHIGSWGQDFRPKQGLLDLLRIIDDADLPIWIRLSSLESTEISDEIIELIKQSKVLLPHLHLPLQSGCNATLRRMNRRHTTDSFSDRVAKIKREMPETCIGADIIVGFPGESEEEFEHTRGFVAGIELDYLHVFPYSRRPGTPAIDMPGHVDGKIIKKRAAVLRRISRSMRRAHIDRHVGSTRPAVVLPTQLGAHPRSALTDNYIQVAVAPPPEFEGKRVSILLTERLDDHALGQLVAKD